jgi:hypothetical protein
MRPLPPKVNRSNERKLAMERKKEMGKEKEKMGK